MSPGLALRQVGSRESSEDGFRRAGLARREPGWTVSRWARIAQAEPGPVPVPAPGSRRGDMELRKPAPVSAGLGPARASPGSARESSWARARPPSHPAPLRPGSRDRRATCEDVCRGHDLAGRPTISTPTLAGQVTISRPGRSPRRGGADEESGGDRFAAPSVRPTRTSAPAPARGPARARRRASPRRTAMRRGDVGPSTAPSRSSATSLSLCYAPSPFTVRGKGA